MAEQHGGGVDERAGGALVDEVGEQHDERPLWRPTAWKARS